MIRISSSSIKTLNTCSFQFWYQYVLKGNTFQSPKTVIGTCAHEIFEILSNQRHKHLVDELLALKQPNIYFIESLSRLAKRILKKHKLSLERWGDDLNLLVVNGLSYDFYQKGSISFLKPEYEFWIKLLKLECRGFIDRAAIFPPNERFPNGYVVCRDFKSQKDLFSDDELNFNLQAQIYQWALWRELGLPVIVEFVLLRHNKIQTVDWIGEEQLNGLISYLEYISDYVQDFNLQKAQSNFAADDKNKEWLCAKYVKNQYELKKDGDPKFCCFARFARKLYTVFKEDGDVKYSTDDQSVITNEEWKTVKTINYGGCPKFNPGNYE